MPGIQALGLANLDAIEATVHRLGIDCEFERTGEVDVATAPHHLAELGAPEEVMSAAQVRAELDSATFLGGVWDKTGVAMLNPAKLAWGLADAAEALGVRIIENTPVRSLNKEGLRIAERLGHQHVVVDRDGVEPQPSQQWLEHVGAQRNPISTNQSVVGAQPLLVQ